MTTPTTPQGLPPHSLPAPSTWSMVGACPIKAHTDMAVKAYAEAYAREALAAQAARQPQAQQGGGENTARAFIEWCKAQPEDRVPVSIDEALNEFEAALATKEPK